MLIGDISSGQSKLSIEEATKVVDDCYRREIARQVAVASLEVMHGNSDSLGGIEKIFQELQEAPQETENLKEVEDDLELILENNKENTQWKFNITSLRKVISGIGPGSFTVIAARIETGKTGFWVSAAASPGGWCHQGATVLAICNEESAQKIRLRQYCACSGLSISGMLENLEEAKSACKAIKGKLKLIDGVGVNINDIPKLIARFSPHIVIVDQLDKVRVDGDFNRGDERLREIYMTAREIAKRHNVAMIGVSQLSAEAQDRLNVDFSMMENSKTGKAAEADLVFCIGANSATGNLRQINIPKNKIGGNHTPVTVQIVPELSRYVE